VNNTDLAKELRRVVAPANVLHEKRDLLAYEYDASLAQGTPDAVVFAENTTDVSRVMRFAHENKIPVVPRGAGTNLSGGTVALEGGIVLELSRMNRILSIDTANQRAVVESGVVNLDLQNALAPLGFFFAPDPASQKISTLGGNAGENAGGPHCLKYGVTTNHVLGLEVVLSDGTVINTGGMTEDSPGYDLTGLFVGSEGTFGVTTKLILRIMRSPEAVKTMLAIYDNLDDASQTVSDIIAAGIIPATLEMMENQMIRAIEMATHSGYPTDAEAILIIEVDGAAGGLAPQLEIIEQLCRANNVREVRIAKDQAERDQLWAGRRAAFGAVSFIAPSRYVQDGTVPRTRLVEMLRKIDEIAKKYDLTIGNVFHAGDGNLHPLILFDARNKEDLVRVEEAGKEILSHCVALGGTITGEHGIGIEKRGAMSLLFSPAELHLMGTIRLALDPEAILNPGKVLPPVGE
jgi:glycolate oxidase